ncbi:hypothetical protein [Thermoleptolyngbya sp. M55_K2018_002]|uniref:hypothetical protein n=1 Tax=Thermoleptolyngbya sp. M55_K2018_002 TaxID=2747808 RepID=UPI0019EB5ED9|nr:hypothetical protein [Thermoleptolyngbya sp. M55_K2018_002]HIK40124.1 hypothetical protein [Thermoleptolyngbya sp. M55_K2018_002]
MSEPNSSQNEQAQNSANPPSPSSWFAGWAEFSTEPPVEAAPESAPADPDVPNRVHHVPSNVPTVSNPEAASSTIGSWEEWQPVNFPNAISADAIERQSVYGEAVQGEAASPQLGRPQPGQPQLGQPQPGRSHFIQPQRNTESRNPSSPNTSPNAAPQSGQSVPPTTRRIVPERPSWDVVAPAASEPEAASPNVADLISLIQELNQCNNALLDRVSMLEDALEQQQARAATAIAADQVQATIQPLEQQIVQLTEQLEATQQLSHRQQVLAETVTQELALSRERITQLEQENQLAQQRYEEQAQRLAHSEALVRDLQTRLQRQQRYTLQFKAALERCLEVPAALLDTPGGAIAQPTPQSTPQPWQAPPAAELLSAPSMLPKAATIRPWSAESAESTVPPKLVNVLANQPENAEETAAWLGDVVSADALLPNALLSNEAEQGRVSLPGSSLAQGGIAQEGTDSDLINAEGTESVAPLDEDGDAATVTTNVIAFQFGAGASHSTPAAAGASPALDPTNAAALELNPQASAELRAAELSAAELSVADNVRSLFREFTDLVNEVGSAPSTDPNAETSLWQDLAKLVEVSAEDLVQAGLIDQLAALSTEAIAPDGEIHPTQPADDPSPNTPSPALHGAEESQLQPPSDNSVSRSAASAPIPPMPPRPVSVQPKLLTMPFETHRWAATAAESAAPARPDRSNPEATDPEAAANLAPVVYPTRPSKKLSSLAAIDLPNFPK